MVSSFLKERNRKTSSLERCGLHQPNHSYLISHISLSSDRVWQRLPLDWIQQQDKVQARNLEPERHPEMRWWVLLAFFFIMTYPVMWWYCIYLFVDIHIILQNMCEDRQKSCFSIVNHQICQQLDPNSRLELDCSTNEWFIILIEKPAGFLMIKMD